MQPQQSPWEGDSHGKKRTRLKSSQIYTLKAPRFIILCSLISPTTTAPPPTTRLIPPRHSKNSQSFDRQVRATPQKISPSMSLDLRFLGNSVQKLSLLR
jgi:hypothetical protein